MSKHRKCDFTTYEFSDEDGITKSINKKRHGYFIRWGIDYIQFDGYVGQYTVAIIEEAITGKVFMVYPSNITLVDCSYDMPIDLNMEMSQPPILKTYEEDK